VRRLTRAPWFGPLLALVGVYVLFAVLSPETFPHRATLLVMLRQTVVVATAATGMALVIILGGIDLSVGSLVALTTVVLASLLKAGAGPVGASLGAAVAAGACGVATGALVSRLKVTPFIVTLGSMSVLRGAAKGLANEQKIDVDPRGLDGLLGAPIGGILPPPGFWIMLLVAGLSAAMLAYTRLGRHVFAVGSSERTALLCGVPVGRVKIAVYGLSGLLAGLAGVMEFATLTVGDPTDSAGLELEVIAAVVIGGGSLSGGEGSILGALLGAMLMTVIRTGCTHLGLPNWVQEIVTGLIIVAAVALDRARHRGS
jgi:ribose/xylose/arabinose/galactoside ABC-type transport system permease subunit